MSKEMYSIPQRPDKQKSYSVLEAADLLNTSDMEIRRIIGYYKIKHEIVRTKQSRAIMIDYDAFRLVKEIHEQKDKRREEAAERAVIRKQKAEEENGADDASAHPLVTDKRCLNINYWPDIVPDCFKECEK